MAGITDISFRRLCRSFGCNFAFTEMINVRSLSYKSKKTKTMLGSDEFDMPLGVQILGCEPLYILKGLEILRKYKFDIIDFNAACPEKKVTKRGEGAGLLKDPKKLNILLKLIVKNSDIPVTVKIRTGWDKDTVNANEIAQGAEDAGIKAVFIHGRTKMQSYSGSVDYDAIRKAKRILKIPLIASGDIFSGELAAKMFERTGCDAVLVARGALGNPWIFKDIDRFLKNGQSCERPDNSGIAAVMRRHLDLCIGYKAEKDGVIIYRKFFVWYTKGIADTRSLRSMASSAKTKSEMLNIIHKFSQLKDCLPIKEN